MNSVIRPDVSASLSSNTTTIMSSASITSTMRVVPAARPFDPFSPNVIVVVRKSGRDAALAAIGSIDSVDHLRLLAREQRLAVPADLSSAVELRTEIVAAAERRITNRIAAAS
jgi:hypothetical protein